MLLQHMLPQRRVCCSSLPVLDVLPAPHEEVAPGLAAVLGHDVVDLAEEAGDLVPDPRPPSDPLLPHVAELKKRPGAFPEPKLQAKHVPQSA